MSIALSPEPGEPAGSGLPGDGWDDDERAGQGLFLTWPAEEMTLQGFCEGGRADTMTPGPTLAMLVKLAAGENGEGLAQLGDDALIGVLTGTQRMESYNEWVRLSALVAFGSQVRRRKDFAADQISFALHMSWFRVTAEVTYATAVATRLPRVFAALRDGKLRPFDVRIIEEATRPLSDEDALKADAELAEAGPGMTFGELRSYASKLVLKLDPEAAKKRKEQARKQTQVRSYRENSGNAGITGREMPTVEVLASMQQVAAWARALREAGVPGTWDELKARAFLDLLQGRDSRPTDTGPDEPADPDGQDGGPADDRCDDSDSPGDRADDGPGSPVDDPAADRPEDAWPEQSWPGDDDAPDDDEPEDGKGPGGSGGSGGAGGSGGPGGDCGPGATSFLAGSAPVLAALVNITVPYSTWRGNTGPPGEVGAFGILDHNDSREAVAAAARSPDSRWCVTLLDPDGAAAAHGCAPGPRHWPTGPPAPASFTELIQTLNIKTLDDVIRGPCDHAQEEHRYQPSRKLRHLVRARNATCTAPGCNRRAAACDLDHTATYDTGGKTCPCNLAPLCRHHHRAKHSEGWCLEQPEPGVLVWRTPAGRTYTTRPTRYPI